VWGRCVRAAVVVHAVKEGHGRVIGVGEASVHQSYPMCPHRIISGCCHDEKSDLSWNWLNASVKD